jgi:hypothetical protein
MSVARSQAERRLQRRAQPAAPSTAAALGLEQAWMRLACTDADAVQPPHALRPLRPLRTLHAPHSGYRASDARRKRHPAVVSRLRAAQRFSRPERRDVPHA